MLLKKQLSPVKCSSKESGTNQAGTPANLVGGDLEKLSKIYLAHNLWQIMNYDKSVKEVHAFARRAFIDYLTTNRPYRSSYNRYLRGL